MPVDGPRADGMDGEGPGNGAGSSAPAPGGDSPPAAPSSSSPSARASPTAAAMHEPQAGLRSQARAQVRAFATGGRVRETGIALVHEGEYILPASGAEAPIEAAELPAGRGEPQVVQYTFPVEVVYAGGLTQAERQDLEEGIWERLLEALERLD